VRRAILCGRFCGNGGGNTKEKKTKPSYLTAEKMEESLLEDILHSFAKKHNILELSVSSKMH